MKVLGWNVCQESNIAKFRTINKNKSHENDSWWINWIFLWIYVVLMLIQAFWYVKELSYLDCAFQVAKTLLCEVISAHYQTKLCSFYCKNLSFSPSMKNISANFLIKFSLNSILSWNCSCHLHMTACIQLTANNSVSDSCNYFVSDLCIHRSVLPSY